MEDHRQKKSVSTEKVTEVDGRGRKTPRQKCNYCGNDIIDLIGRLKDHLMKCKREDLKN